MMTYDEVAHAAVELSRDERRALIQALISSLDVYISDPAVQQLESVLQEAAPDSALHRIIGDRIPTRSSTQDWKEDYTDYLIRKYIHDDQCFQPKNIRRTST